MKERLKISGKNNEDTKIPNKPRRAPLRLTQVRIQIAIRNGVLPSNGTWLGPDKVYVKY